MSRKLALSSSNEVVSSQILSIILSPSVSDRHVLFGLEGFYGEPLLRQFALFSQTLRFVCFAHFENVMIE